MGGSSGPSGVVFLSRATVGPPRCAAGELVLHAPVGAESRVDSMEETSKNGGILYAVDESPPLWMVILLAFQHVVIMYGENTLFPGILGRMANAPEEHIAFATFGAVVISAVSSLLQLIRFGKFGSGFVIFMGSSTAYLACSLDALHAGGFALLATLSVLSAPAELLVSYFLRHLRTIITPPVGGIVILLIVISLMPVCLKEWMGHPGEPHYASRESLAVGMITLFTMLSINLYAGKKLKVWGPVLALGVGYVAAWTFGILDFEHFKGSEWMGLPRGNWPGLTLDLRWEHLPLLAAFVVVTVVNSIQAIGNCMLAQSYSVRDFKKVDYDRVQGCLYADGTANILAGLAGTLPNETYGENVPVLGMTGVASRSVGFLAVGFLFFLAFCPKISALILDMPGPVFGGFLVGLLALMFHSGLHLIHQSGMSPQMGLLIGVSMCVGMMAESREFFSGTMPAALQPFTTRAVAAGGLMALVLNTIYHFQPKPRVSFKVEGVPEKLPDLVRQLADGVESLQLTPSQASILQLSCEEVFQHIQSESESEGVPKRRVKFRIVRLEEGVFVEIRAATRMSDVDGPARPETFAWASEEDCKALGLYLIRNMVRQIRHVHISGYTYVSFIIP